MDIGLPDGSPRGVNFMPSSPLPMNSVRPWIENLNEQCIDYFIGKPNLQLLTLLKHSDYRYYLNHQDEKSQHLNKAMRRRAATNKFYTLKHFEL